ncbi:50S ribosomal protein L19 [Patescibacteria group bacterium]|nr:50S ribosomal protein L19 [Patescibacteria group bacterium]MBU1868450.1 50S ribosomal protein L19 [Patescibacteria group bacterium]
MNKQFNVGDTVEVISKIQEKGKERLSKFMGVVIAQKGSLESATFTVRKVTKGGLGVERIFPLRSPNIKDITIIKEGKVKRSKLYYIRDRTGKAATYVKPRFTSK